MKKCLFCGSTKKLTNEHVIPQWLLKELGMPEKHLLMSHTTSLGIGISKRTHRFKNLVNGLVCAACNNGWMSQLEVDVNNLLIPMMQRDGLEGQSFWASLLRGRETLARWVVKTAAVLNYATNYRRIVPRNHFESVYRSVIPEGVCIWFGFTSNSEPLLAWRQNQSFMFNSIAKDGFLIQEKISELTTRGNGPYKISFQFEHLLLKICYMPFENFEPYDDTILSCELWPYVRVPDNSKLFEDFEDIDDFDINGFYIQTEEFEKSEPEGTSNEAR